MDDLNRILAETMHDAAGHAPSGAGLLGNVHGRSRRYRRRRFVAAAVVSTAAAVVVAGIPIVTVYAGRPDPAAPPIASVPAPPTTPGAVTLTAGWQAPAFPYTLPATDGMSAPVASMKEGTLTAFFEATEQQHHADVTITVSEREPAFTTSAGETTEQVRGHAGTLRTVDVTPARQLTLSWQESSSRWIQLATDDTYTPDQVVALANSITAASLAVLPPFDLGLSPAGLVPDTVSASRMTFRPARTAPGAGGFSTVLRKRQQLTGINKKVNGHDAVLTRRAGEVTLSVDVTDWDATLQITVGNGLTIGDADLIRYAAGVRVLNRSNPE
jgi:hypothetical protein